MRREIADIAKRLFQEDGYAKISIRRIASEMGCSPMTLYKYYPAKIDILRTLWADVFSDLFDQLEALPQASESLLCDLGAAYVRYWLNHTEYYRLVFISDGVTQSDVSIFLDSPALVQRFSIFGRALTSYSPENIHSDKLKLKLDAYMCFLNGITHNLITISGYQWSDPDRLVSLAVSAVTD
ncbi:TetR/AcrR family transcriptional regulator [Fretibacter rubidus]|uniref:TetR/AcrR family transcriptional regulator n=1 Tax=Fretibacter rubidus TaxID=570162 RepID=UPI00352A73F9